MHVINGDHEDDHCRHGEGSGILILPLVMLTIAAIVTFLAWLA